MKTQLRRRMYSWGIVLIVCAALGACSDHTLQDLQAQKESLSNRVGSTQPGVTPMALPNTWAQIAVHELYPFGQDVQSFLINGKAYIAMPNFGELWVYDLATGSFMKKGTTPFAFAFNIGAFTIGTKGYFVSGDNFWEYDSNTNAWTAKAPFPGDDRYAAVCFAVGGKGYLCSGQKIVNTGPPDEAAKDLWEYNPASNHWIQKANIPVARMCATGVATPTRGYVGCGVRKYTNASGGITTQYLNDWWEYNPSTNVWTQKATFPGTGRVSMESFTVDNYPYSGGGFIDFTASPPTPAPDMWRYDPFSNQWKLRAPFPTNFDGYWATTFGDANNGYLVVGNFKEMWKYFK